MKKRILTTVITGLACVGMALPSSSADCCVVNGAVSLAGATTALVVDVPEGMVLDTLYRAPLKTTKYLADKFGDQNGLEQNFVGALIGVPVGMVWGLPYGFIAGGHKALTDGWDKPFKMDSYIVGDEK